MDSHVFRLLGLELSSVLAGARIEKIHAPAPDLMVFSIFSHGKKQRLVLFFNRQNPAVYLTNSPLPNPMEPGSKVMRLRKHFAGKRIDNVHLDWIKRRIVLSANNNDGPWLMLDLSEGAEIYFEASVLAEKMAEKNIIWPAPSVIEKLCLPENTAIFNPGEAKPWENYPVLTPMLRKTLAKLDFPDAAALMADLEYETEKGCGTICFYPENPEANSKSSSSILSAWPLPDELLPDNVLKEAEYIVIGLQSPPLSVSTPETDISSPVSFPALMAARAAFENKIGEHLGLVLNKDGEGQRKSAVRKLERLIKTLDQEEKRLNGLLELRAKAIKIQENLWRFAPEERLSELVLGDIEKKTDTDEHYENFGAKNENITIPLNPLKSLRENMAHMFHQSDRGARGLVWLEERRKNVQSELALMLGAQGGIALKAIAKNEKSKKQDVIKDQTKAKQPISSRQTIKAGKNSEKLVQAFQSSDGFVLLRGRSAEGNHALLKMAMPYDLWFHAKDGPSAHLICRRAHAGVELPANTMQEAGILVGLKSWQRNAAKAEIMYALAKDVHPIKGQKAGTVRVDKTIGSILVELDTEVEERLSIS